MGKGIQAYKIGAVMEERRLKEEGYPQNLGLIQ
jgi:hypothetical protein